MQFIPKVSIILPTYNRAKFLPEAFESIAGQTFKDWELIIVDDGSTDNTGEIINELTSKISQPHQYIYQDNQGAYGARNTGLDHAKGDFIAFYDSDDLWLPHHLTDCVIALDKNPDVDWVYGSCRIIERKSQKCIVESTFYLDGIPKPILKISQQMSDGVYFFDNRTLRKKVMFRTQPFCGFQNSLIRSRVFADTRLDNEFRNEAEDSVFLIKHILAGGTMCLIDNVHVIYQTHDAHSSTAGTKDHEKGARVIKAVINGYQKLGKTHKLRFIEKLRFRRMLSKIVFWQFGYSTLWANKKKSAAIVAMWQGIKLWPVDPTYWKTFVLAELKSIVRNSD